MPESVAPRVLVQTEDFDPAAEMARAATAAPGAIGGVVSFMGLCRDEAGSLSALQIEHYPGMAEAEIGRIAAEAAERWALAAVTVVHRFGTIRPGENIVLVVTASAHRQAAFEAASFVMDYLKSQAPFWKKEHRAEGGDGGWVEARQIDKEAAGRWRRLTEPSPTGPPAWPA